MPNSTISDTQERERKSGARGRDCTVSASETAREACDHDGMCAECEHDMALALRVTKEEYESTGLK